MLAILVLFEISTPAGVEVLLVSIPESFGLLAFGIALVGTAVLIRTLLAHAATGKRHEK